MRSTTLGEMLSVIRTHGMGSDILIGSKADRAHIAAFSSVAEADALFGGDARDTDVLYFGKGLDPRNFDHISPKEFSPPKGYHLPVEDFLDTYVVSFPLDGAFLRLGSREFCFFSRLHHWKLVYFQKGTPLVPNYLSDPSHAIAVQTLASLQLDTEVLATLFLQHPGREERVVRQGLHYALSNPSLIGTLINGELFKVLPQLNGHALDAYNLAGADPIESYRKTKRLTSKLTRH